MNPTNKKLVDEMTRDLTQVQLRTKSEVRERLKELYELGRKSVLDEMKHEQEKLLDGFAHPKDCKVCLSFE